MNMSSSFRSTLWCMVAALVLALVGPVRASAPQITYVPSPIAVIEGEEAYLYVNGTGSEPMSFQWFKDGVTLVGATNWYLRITPMTAAAVGSYTLRATNSEGSATSAPILLSLRLPDPPTIWSQPYDVSISEGQSFDLYTYASGTYPFQVTWKKDGVVVFTETTTSSSSDYSVAEAKLSDAGSYVATFVNAAGSASTTAVVVDVAPAVAPAITIQPAATSVYRSNYANLFFDYSGTSPTTIQWFRNGQAIVGATSQWLTINNATDADAGTYSATVSNIKGTATTNGAAVVVDVPPVPNIVNQSTNTTVVQGNDLYLSVYAQSPVSQTYQWYYNGVALAGKISDSMNLSNFQQANAGTYHCVVTNNAGSSVSSDIQVTYESAQLPVFVSQPSDVTCFPGESASINASLTCNATYTVQWYRDGVVFANQNSTWLSVPTSEADSAHVYRLRATSAAGSVDSNEVRVVVGPVQPARITQNPGPSLYTSGWYFYPWVSVSGTEPLSYQWYRDGVPISGANRQSFSISYLTAADYAEYYVVVSNSAGTDTSKPIIARPYPEDTGFPAAFWIDAVAVDGVYYFLMTDPGRIERYDLATETWLPAWSVDGKPSAFTIASDAIYVAEARTVTQYPRTWGTGTPLLNTATDVRRLLAVDEFLFVSSVGYSDNAASYNRRTGALIASTWSDGFRHRLAYEPTSGCIASAGSAVVLSADGRFAKTMGFSGVHGNGTGGMCLLPGSADMVDLSGVVFDTTAMTVVGNFDGQVDDIVLGDTGYLVLRGSRVVATRANFSEVASLSLPGRGERLVRKGDSVLVFGQTTVAGGRPPVWKCALSALQKPVAVAPINPERLVFTPDDIQTDAQGTVYLLNRLERNIVRWCPAARTYLPSVPLVEKAEHFAVSADGLTIYADNGSSQIRRLQLSGGGTPGGEACYAALAKITSMQCVGPTLVVATDDYGPIVSIDAAGDVVDVLANRDDVREVIWRSGPGRLIVGGYSAGSFRCFPLGPDGMFGAQEGSGYRSASKIRVSPDGGSFIVDEGFAYSLPAGGALGILPRTIDDVAWSGGVVCTMRDIGGNQTEIAALHPTTYLLQRKRAINGSPVRLFAAGPDTLVAITKDQGRLVFRILNARYLADIPGGFDVEAYLARNPDVAAAIGDVPDKFEKAWQHYCTYGMAEGRMFSDDFQVDDYLAINPDLQAVFGTNREGALLHWLTYGKLEGRMGCVPPEFEEDTYFALNPDVEQVFGHNRRLAWFHYATYGILEGRSLDSWFSPAAYLAMYPDLVPALDGKPLAALAHWFTYGRAEGRGIPDWFDIVGYLARYPDVEAAYGTDLYGAWRHFVRWGAAAGRSPDLQFDPVAYLAAYPELRAGLGGDLVKALQHWIDWGKQEGRLGTMPDGWDPAYYFAHNLDLEAFGDDEAILWQHCIAYGVLEGREVAADVVPSVYLARNPDLNASFAGSQQKALLHWYLYGRAEGRVGR